MHSKQYDLVIDDCIGGNRCISNTDPNILHIHDIVMLQIQIAQRNDELTLAELSHIQFLNPADLC